MAPWRLSRGSSCLNIERSSGLSAPCPALRSPCLPTDLQAFAGKGLLWLCSSCTSVLSSESLGDPERLAGSLCQPWLCRQPANLSSAAHTCASTEAGCPCRGCVRNDSGWCCSGGSRMPTRSAKDTSQGCSTSCSVLVPVVDVCPAMPCRAESTLAICPQHVFAVQT